jgi:hypothetical protein
LEYFKKRYGYYYSFSAGSFAKMLNRFGEVRWPCENPLLILLAKENDYPRLLGKGCGFFASA